MGEGRAPSPLCLFEQDYNASYKTTQNINIVQINSHERYWCSVE